MRDTTETFNIFFLRRPKSFVVVVLQYSSSWFVVAHFLFANSITNQHAKQQLFKLSQLDGQRTNWLLKNHYTVIVKGKKVTKQLWKVFEHFTKKLI